MDFEERIKKIVEVNGPAFQYEIAIEECSEVIEAIQKFKRGRIPITKVLEEMADVLVTFACVQNAIESDGLYENPGDYITEILDKKTKWIETYKGKTNNPVTWQTVDKNDVT